MNRFKKIVLIAVAMLLVVTVSVAATAAYLMHQTDMEKNAFSVGKVKISLDESRVDKYGRLLDVDGNLWTAESGKDKAPRVTENSYTFVPGKTYVKDPVVHVAEDSEPCVVFVVIYFPGLTNAPFYSDMFSQLQNIYNWFILDGFDKVPEGLKNDYVVWAHNGTVQPGEDVQLFSTLTIKTDVTYEKIEAIDLSQLTITAYALQDEGTQNWSYESDVWPKLVELCDPFDLNK